MHTQNFRHLFRCYTSYFCQVEWATEVDWDCQIHQVRLRVLAGRVSSKMPNLQALNRSIRLTGLRVAVNEDVTDSLSEGWTDVKEGTKMCRPAKGMTTLTPSSQEQTSPCAVCDGVSRSYMEYNGIQTMYRYCFGLWFSGLRRSLSMEQTHFQWERMRLVQ